MRAPTVVLAGALLVAGCTQPYVPKPLEQVPIGTFSEAPAADAPAASSSSSAAPAPSTPKDAKPAPASSRPAAKKKK
jgi:hypothetical protein